MICLRNRPAPGKSFRAFLEEVKENALYAYENQEYPFEELVRKLGLQGEARRNPLFDVGLVMQNTDSGDAFTENDTLKITPYASEDNVSRFDMLMDVSEVGGIISLRLEYSTNLFKPSSIDRFIAHYKEILQQVLENKEIKLKEIILSTDLQPAASVERNIDFGF